MSRQGIECAVTSQMQQFAQLDENCLSVLKSSFHGKRVLVTGATGFIGWRVCEFLTQLETEVYGASRLASDSTLPVGVHPVTLDLSNRKATNETLQSLTPNIVFHLAGLVTGGQSRDLLWPTLQSNLLASINLLDALVNTVAESIIIAGSSEEPPDQQVESVPTSPYSAAKLATTMYTRMFCRLYDVPAVILRPFMTYGPRQGGKKLIPHIILSILRAEAPILGNKNRTCDFVYIDDMVRAFLMAATRPELIGKTLEVGSGKGVTIQEIAERLTFILKTEIKPVYSPDSERIGESNRIANVATLHETLGWGPHWTLNEGLQATVTWYMRNNY